MEFKEWIYWIEQIVFGLVFIIASQYIGAGVRWALKLRKRPYQDILDDSPTWNSGIAVMFVFGLLYLFDYVVNYFFM